MVQKSVITKNETLLWILILLWAIYHVLTLQRWPLPWFDEVFLADISHQFHTSGRFFPSIVAYSRGSREAFAYGPIYPLITQITWLFSASYQPYIFRLFSLIPCVLVGIALAKYTMRSYPSQIIWIGVFLLEPIFSLCLHHGRMEPLALLFIGISLILLHSRTSFWSGIFLSLALLTSLRSIIWVIPLCSFSLLSLYSKPKHLIVFSGLLLAPLVVWWLYAYGSWEATVLQFHRLIDGNHSAVHGYLGFTTYFPKSYWLLAPVFLMVFGKSLVVAYTKKDPIDVVCLIAILFFYSIVRDWGTYTIWVWPAWVILTVRNGMFIPRWISVVYIVLFGWIFLSKAIYYSFPHPSLDASSASIMIKDHVHSQSKVVGPETFYYLTKPTGAHYHLPDKFMDAHLLATKLAIHYQPTHLIIPLHESHLQPKWKPYFDSSRWKAVATFQTEPSQYWSQNIYSPIDVEKNGYQFILYKRMDQ